MARGRVQLGAARQAWAGIFLGVFPTICAGWRGNQRVPLWHGRRAVIQFSRSMLSPAS